MIRHYNLLRKFRKQGTKEKKRYIRGHNQTFQKDKLELH